MTDPSFQKDLALLGAGYWGKNLARNFNAFAVLHTICDADQPTLDSYGADYTEVLKATSPDDVLRNPAITKCAIATPAVTHYQLVKQALEAGKHVLVEKPLCLEVKEAEELVALARASNRVLMVG